MENVDTIWNLEYKISKNSNSTIVRTAFWPYFWPYKEKQRNKLCSKTSSVHSCMSLIPTFNHFVNIVQYVKWK